MEAVPPVNEALLADIVAFGGPHVSSGDIDPAYPVLKHIIDSRYLSSEQCIWAVLCYVAYYNLASALVCLEAYPDGPPAEMDPMIAGLPCGTERRGFRGGIGLARHMDSLYRHASAMGGLGGWLSPAIKCPPSGDNWTLLNVLVQGAWGNGRWAAYKTAELFQKVLRLPLQPTDCGHAFSSGPRKGLALLYGPVVGNTPDAVAILDAQSNDLWELLMGHGIEGIDIAQVETILCDFHSMVEGRYYVGHDIDQQLEQLRVATYLPKHLADQVLKARRAAFPRQYLGEEMGWTVVDKKRARAYKDTGRILVRSET